MNAQQGELVGAAGEGRVEQGESVVGCEGGQAKPAHPVPVGVGDCTHARIDVPHAERQRGGGEPLRPAVVGEGVEEDVGRRVVALPGGEYGPARRREQHEGLEIQVVGEFVQMPGGVRLGPQHGVEAVSREFGDQCAVGDSGGVHDGGQRMLGRDPGQHARHLFPVGDVGRHDRDLGAQRLQLPGQLHRAGRGPAATAHQNQPSYAVLHDQMACHHSAQAARATRHQHRAVTAPRLRTRPTRSLVVGNPGNQAWYGHVAAVDGELGFRRRGRRGQNGEGLGTSVGVQEREAARVLGLGGPHQTPHRRLRQVEGVFETGRDGVPGDDDEPGAGEPLVRQPRPYRRQDVRQLGA
ncbi:hypothetical protein SHKM778_32450 [Streptomyces sp. KM77-8]|uniref:Uncharacterized protein n=1 Tax=Streptomyces haneummycinicus TaxID=3074435 RepID=A0AAT9HHQ8_9ACTN